jgi:hypothetical protein
MAVVVVKMKFCNKTQKITVTPNDDGTFHLHVATDCPEVRDYVKAIGDTLTMDDIMDRTTSKIFSYDNLQHVTMTCLAPNGIINAAWLEAGMLSKSRAKEVKENVVSFEKVE